MRIAPCSPAELDEAAVAEIVGLRTAVDRQDAPHQPPPTPVAYRRMLLHGWDGRGPELLWLAHDDGKLVAVADIWMPHWDNRQLAYVDAQVRPDRRGRGIGSALMKEAAAAAAAAGRHDSLLADAWTDSPGGVFLQRQGFRPAQLNVQRRLSLLGTDDARVDGLHDDAATHAGAYELVRLVGAAPDLRADMVQLFAAINDAPLDDLDIEDDVYTAERVRCFEEAQTAMGQRLYRLVARRTGDGAWAGHTVLTVDPSRPTWGDQGDTSVVRSHRGNRLGLLLKTEMLRWLRQEEPQLEQIDTWNSASNTAMIAVNDALGCTVVGQMTGWQRKR